VQRPPQADDDHAGDDDPDGQRHGQQDGEHAADGGPAAPAGGPDPARRGPTGGHSDGAGVSHGGGASSMASVSWGASNGPPKPPGAARDAPAKPWRPSISDGPPTGGASGPRRATCRSPGWRSP